MIILEDLGEDQDGRITRTPNAEITVGRGVDCDISYEKGSAPTVSREHARIVFDGKWYRIDDLGSRHGTWVNGQRLRGRVYLRQGDVIQLGGGSGPQLRVGFRYDREKYRKSQKSVRGGAPPWLWIGIIGAMLFMMLVVVGVMMMVAGD